MTLPEGTTKQLEIQARYALAAPLAPERRILDLGGHSAAGLLLLAQSEPAEIAATHAQPRALQRELDAAGIEGIEVRPDGSTLPFEDGSYDLIICHDLAERVSEDPQFMDELRRILSPEGYLLAAVANPEGTSLTELGGVAGESAMSYQDLHAMVMPHFAAMTLFGQLPLTATLFYDAQDESEEPGLTLDRSLLPEDDEQAGWYVLLFGPEPQHRDDLGIVQLPFGLSVEAAHSLAGAASDSEQEALASSEEDESEQAGPVASLDAAAAQVMRTLELDRQAAMARVHSAEAELFAKRVTGSVSTAAQKPAGEAAAGSLGRASEIDRVRAENAQLHEQAQALEAQLHKTRAALKTAEDRAEQLGAMPDEVRAREQELSARLAHLEHNDRTKMLEQEVERVRHDKASYQAQIKDLLEEVGQLRAREDKRQQEMQHMQAANSAAHQQLLRVQDQLQSRSTNEPEERVIRLQVELEAAQEAARAANAARQGLETEVAQLRNPVLIATQPVASRPRDAVGRVLDTAVEELEDLLKDVAPPASSGR